MQYQYQQNNMNFTRISNVKSRLIQIIESVLVRYEDCSDALFGLDESKLEEWVHVLKAAIVEKEKVVEPIEKKILASQKMKGIVLPRASVSFEKSSKQPMEIKGNRLIEIVNGNKVIIHTLNNNSKSKSTKKIDEFTQTGFGFPSDTLKRFCSVVEVARNKYIIAGGCLYSNPRTKSNSISLFDSESGTFRKIGELVEPLSSHACVYVEPKVYFIGGKKDEGIITRACSYYHLHQQQTVEIAALNYGCASLSVTNYQGVYIYKAGGIGECFGEFSLSPYIERYNIQEDYWEVINPCISPSLVNQFGCFQLFAHSLMYSAEDKLVIAGGYDISKKATNFGVVIKLKQINKDFDQIRNENEGLDTQHEIISFGPVEGLQAGGYWTNQTITQPLSGQIMALQTCFNLSLATKPIKVPHSKTVERSK